jgi:hypothetical protein
VIGAIGIALICLVFGPMLVWVGIGALSAVMSMALTVHAKITHPGSELIETNI